VIALDTNVLVRHATEDDPDQTRSARAVLDELSAEAPGFVSIIVLAELYWVLRRGRPRLSASAVHDVIEILLDAPEIEIEDEESVTRALDRARSGADFADALIGDAATLYGCTETVTFDRRAAEQLGWRLLD
jgi:predicted nucleic-acid-binding protein